MSAVGDAREGEVSGHHTSLRSARLDAMRGLAVTGIVLSHAVKLHVGDSSPAFAFVSAFAMPLFALVSGYLTSPPDDDGAHWLGWRARRLLVPFGVWAVLHWSVAQFASTGLDLLGIEGSLPGYLIAVVLHPWQGLWFLLVAFYWSAIAVLISRYAHSVRAIAGIAAAAVALSGAVVWARQAGTFESPADFGLVSLLGLLPYFAGGYALGRMGLSVSEGLPVRAGVAGLAALAAVAVSVVVTTRMGATPLRASLDVVESVLGAVGFALLAASAPERMLAPLASLGGASLGVYAMHFAFLRVGAGSGWTLVATSFVVALAASFALTKLVRLSPVSAEILLGEARVRRRGRPRR
ncbi:MAG: acyltransferase [Actinobacteria bacterium]|nr:MAG: acyltransferase [Actinomycetota bacterium]